jgi:Thioredoxin
MEFLHINPSTANAHMFDKMVDDGKHVFVLIYMEGCGPCEATRPEWTKIQNILGDSQQKMKYPGVVIADVDQSVSNNIKHISGLSGFPTMRYISDKGKVIENYEKDRSIDAFINWIDSKHGTFVDNTPSPSSFKTMTSPSATSRRTAQGRTRRRQRRSSRKRIRSKSSRRQSKKNAGWKWKPRNKRNK